MCVCVISSAVPKCNRKGMCLPAVLLITLNLEQELIPSEGPMEGEVAAWSSSRLLWVVLECIIICRWLLGMPVTRVLGRCDRFLEAIEILSGYLLLLSSSPSPSPVIVGDAAFILQMPVIRCPCHRCRKMWRHETKRVKASKTKWKKKNEKRKKQLAISFSNNLESSFCGVIIFSMLRVGSIV